MKRIFPHMISWQAAIIEYCSAMLSMRQAIIILTPLTDVSYKITDRFGWSLIALVVCFVVGSLLTFYGLLRNNRYGIIAGLGVSTMGYAGMALVYLITLPPDRAAVFIVYTAAAATRMNQLAKGAFYVD